MNTLAKFIFSSLTVLLLLLITAYPILSADTSVGADPLRYGISIPQKLESTQLEKFQEAVIIQPDYNKETFDAQSFTDTLNSINTGILGCVGSVCPEVKGVHTQGGGGIINITSSAISFMYTIPPASGMQYLADLGKKFNIASPVYAQDFGRLGTGDILRVWRGFRNAAYALFVVLFVVIGFAIMFRVKLNPQTVITIQSALPRIIIALLLVTFSYAIAGMLLDLVGVTVGLVDAILEPLLPGFWGSIANFGKGLLTQATVGAIVGGIIGAFGGLNPASIGAGAIMGSALFMLVLGLLFVFAVFRLLWMYLMAYVRMLLQIILAPLIILFNTLPGRPVFWGWFGGLLAEVSVFVTSYILIATGWILMRAIDPWGNTPDVPSPPVLGGFPVLGGIVSASLFSLVKSLIGLGILIMTPNIANVVRESIARGPQVGQPFGFGIVWGGVERAGAPKAAQFAGGAIAGAFGKVKGFIKI